MCLMSFIISDRYLTTTLYIFIIRLHSTGKLQLQHEHVLRQVRKGIFQGRKGKWLRLLQGIQGKLQYQHELRILQFWKVGQGKFRQWIIQGRQGKLQF